MKISVNQYGQILEEIAALSSSEGQDQALTRLAKIILRNKDQKKISKIAMAWEKIIQKRLGIVRGEIFLAGELTEEKKLLLQEIIKEKQEQLGKKIDFVIKKDDGLLGGVKLKIGDRLWDASWRRKIFQLSEQLKSE